MKYDSDDALDRALFALPLEEPPADLRASILSATVYRPAPLFKPWEVMTLGALAAVVLWLVAVVVMGGGDLFLVTVETIGRRALDAVSNYSTLGWIAAGGATAIWLSIFTGFQPSTKGVPAQRR